MEKRIPGIAAVSLAVIVGIAIASTFASGDGQRPTPEQIIQHENLEVNVPDFPARGLILDIGGGTEGVIGQLKGTQIIAIDLLKRELEEAPAEPLLKTVMDVRELKFLDQIFPRVRHSYRLRFPHLVL
jgi:hypothetical protein